jgi:hypothetical protein
MDCPCALCRQPLPLVRVQTAAEALALNRDYEARRRRYRTEHPHVTRTAIAEEAA